MASRNPAIQHSSNKRPPHANDSFYKYQIQIANVGSALDRVTARPNGVGSRLEN